MSNVLTTAVSAGTQIKSATENTNNDALATMQNAKAGASLTSTQSVPTGSETLLALATELYDPGGNFDNTGGNYSFTVPYTGYYQVNLQVRCTTLTAGKLISARVKNGATVIAETDTYAAANASTHANTSKIVLLTVADVIKAYVVHDNGSNRDINSTNFMTFFDIHLLSV